MSCCKFTKNKDNSKNNSKDNSNSNKDEEIIENIEKKSVDKILNNIYKEKINTIFTDIKKIADADTSDKSQDIKHAEACFKLLGQETRQLCPHGLQFFQCMPCSH
jgi:hypothetical protein